MRKYVRSCTIISVSVFAGLTWCVQWWLGCWGYCPVLLSLSCLPHRSPWSAALLTRLTQQTGTAPRTNTANPTQHKSVWTLLESSHFFVVWWFSTQLFGYFLVIPLIVKQNIYRYVWLPLILAIHKRMKHSKSLHVILLQNYLTFIDICINIPWH